MHEGQLGSRLLTQRGVQGAKILRVARTRDPALRVTVIYAFSKSVIRYSETSRESMHTHKPLTYVRFAT